MINIDFLLSLWYNEDMSTKKQTKISLVDQIYQKVFYPTLDWFKEAKVSKKTVKIGSNQMVVRAFTADLIVSLLILSVLVNIFVFSSWLLYQVDPTSRSLIVDLLFG